MPNIQSRKYFIDWLRIALIVSVFFFHIGMIFDNSNWPVKNEVKFDFLDKIMGFFHLWRMPLLFLVSGIGTFYALGFRTTKIYLKERTVRVFVPYIIGVFTLIPIQVYFEKRNDYDSFSHFYSEFFVGIYPIGNFSWTHHLWFLLYLFLMSLILAPFLNYFRDKRFTKFRDSIVNFSSKKLGLNWFVLVLFVSQIILTGNEEILAVNLSKFIFYFLFFLIGFLLVSDNRIPIIIEEQKRLFFYQTLIIIFLIFSRKYLISDITILEYSKIFLKSYLTWSCGMTMIGYFKKYFNKDSKYRKQLNEGIYPFYLLHQPAIIIAAFYVVNWPISVYFKIPIIIFLSLLLILSFYFIFIKPLNFFRIMFGLKPLKKSPYYIRYARYSVTKIMSLIL